jgi:hypothetical protein
MISMVAVMIHNFEYREEVENSAQEIIDKKDENQMKDQDSDFKRGTRDP